MENKVEIDEESEDDEDNVEPDIEEVFEREVEQLGGFSVRCHAHILKLVVENKDVRLFFSFCLFLFFFVVSMRERKK